MPYLYYPPFCTVLSSKDKRHKKKPPCFSARIRPGRCRTSRKTRWEGAGAQWPGRSAQANTTRLVRKVSR